MATLPIHPRPDWEEFECGRRRISHRASRASSRLGAALLRGGGAYQGRDIVPVEDPRRRWCVTLPTTTARSAWTRVTCHDPQDRDHRCNDGDEQGGDALGGALKAPRSTEAAACLDDYARAAGWTYQEYLAAVLEREVAAAMPGKAAGCCSRSPVCQQLAPHPSSILTP